LKAESQRLHSHFAIEVFLFGVTMVQLSLFISAFLYTSCVAFTPSSRKYKYCST
jgi:hypothetical protein